MSYELIHQSTQTSRTFSRQFWLKALELARNYGWKPLGTCPPPNFDFYEPIADWDGKVLTNDGQTVKRVDAFWLADTLEKALKDISDTSLSTDWNSEFRQNDLPAWLSPEEIEIIEDELQDGLLDVLGMAPLEFFAGSEKRAPKSVYKILPLGKLYNIVIVSDKENLTN